MASCLATLTTSDIHRINRLPAVGKVDTLTDTTALRFATEHGGNSDAGIHTRPGNMEVLQSIYRDRLNC